MTDFPRHALVAELTLAAASGSPLLVAGPLGFGKSWLLRAVTAELARRGTPAVHLDLLLAAASPERFASAASEALNAAGHDASGAARAAEALEALARAPGPLVLDEITELRALSTFPGLRDVERRFGDALRRRPHTLLATSFPTTATARLGAFEMRELGPLAVEELEDTAGETAARLLAAGGGAPGRTSALLRRLRDGEELHEAWLAAMGPGGELDLACRAAWETLLLRSRGYAMSKAVLEAVALEEGLNLTALVGRVGRTPGAVRDYLGWLLDVDALRARAKRYYFADPLLRDWLRLNAGGRTPDEAALRAVAEERLGGAPAEPASGAPRRVDSLMEID